MSTPNASYSITMRLHYPNQVGRFSQIAAAIAEAGGDVGAIDIVSATSREMERDVTVNAADDAHANRIVDRVLQVPGVRVVNYSDRTFLRHLGGKIEINSKIPVKTRDDLTMAYTPGVARVSQAIHADPSKAYNLTIKGNTVAIVTDGTAVLGLGDIGPAAMPVIEGKALLFKEFGGVDAFIGVSQPGVLTERDVARMARDPIVFALANPTPEIAWEDAAAHVRVMATGRSDYPNQINNVLAFPGVFRCALDCRAREITHEMKFAATLAISELVAPDELSEEYIIPSVFDRRVAPAVASAIVDAAERTGVARRFRTGVAGAEVPISRAADR